MASPEVLRFVVLSAGLVLVLVHPEGTAAWDADLELFDLVEEIPQTFYEFLSVNPVKRRLLFLLPFLSFFIFSYVSSWCLILACL